MRRPILAAAVTGGMFLAIVAWKTVSSAKPGDLGPNPAAAAKAPVEQLPIGQVVLFSSGVGYFQREGEVQGNTRVDLSFAVTDINDLLKSMVLQDLGGGHIAAVNYDSQAPVEKTLRSFAVNLTNNPSFGQILNQARGEKVEAVLQQGAAPQPGTLTGVIVGLEHKKEAIGKDVIEGEFLNMWCAEGMRSVKLGDVQRVRFLNPVMDSEVKKALEVLSLSHDTQKKAVSLAFAGEGKRTVKVGYVVENPIWKTSYRLVLDSKGKPFLQGWAVVENTQDEDWNHVRMGLVAGRPISFQMDLYQPLYVPRPVVEPELFASLRPPTYSGAMDRWGSLPQKDSLGGRGEGKGEAKAKKLIEDVEMNIRAQKIVRGGGGGGSPIDPREGVHSAAVATELGDYFQYIIENPGTLPRQKSALLPIVNQEVEAAKVSIYNEATHSKFPLLGLRFKNTTKLHLMQGPITVFENSSYAGDARILDLQPREERLISYAIDLGVEVEPVVHEAQDRIIQVKIAKGIVQATHKVRASKTYNIKNRAEHDRTVLIEHPYRQQFKLLTPEKADERARDVYRFEIPVAAGKTAKRDVVEETDQLHTTAMANFDDQTVRFIMNQGVTSEKVKVAIQQAVTLKTRLAATQQEIAHKERRLKDRSDDQGRLRANLKEVPAHQRRLQALSQEV